MPEPLAKFSDLFEYRDESLGALPPDWPPNLCTLWAPYDNVHGALVATVLSAKRQLLLAMFGFTDDELADAVERALHDKNVHCQITLDASQAGGTVEKRMLHKWSLLDSNSVAVGTSEHGSIMHRKTGVVDMQIRFAGSTNWSLDAERKQDNELTFVNSALVCADAAMLLGLEHEKARTQMAARKRSKP